MTRPAKILNQGLNFIQFMENEAIIKHLFGFPEFNKTDSFRFAELWKIKLIRDSYKVAEFTSAISTIKTHLDPTVDDEVHIQQEDVIEYLLAELSKRNILLDESICELTREGEFARRGVYNLFRDLLTIHAIEKDAHHLNSIINNDAKNDNPHLLSHDGLISYLTTITNTTNASREKSILDYFASLDFKDQFVHIKSLGDGDCFYHSVMINIIYQVLSGEIEESSPITEAIKNNLLPAINARFEKLGAAKLDFSDLSLKQSILLLLRTINLQRLGATHAALLDSTDNDNEEITIIKNCDFFHLLKDICAPALRRIMLDKLDAQSEEVKSVMQVSCTSYLISTFAKELGFYCLNTVASAQDQQHNNEIVDVDINLRNDIQARWRQLFQEKRYAKELTNELFILEKILASDALSEEIKLQVKNALDQAKETNLKDLKKSTLITQVPQLMNLDNYALDKLKAAIDQAKFDYIKQLYNNFWLKNGTKEMEDYKKIHSFIGVMAGVPQEQALASALNSNLYLVDRVTCKVTPLIPEQPANSAAFLFEFIGVHFNAQLRAVKPFLAHALQSVMDRTLNIVGSLRKEKYSWTSKNTFFRDSSNAAVVQRVSDKLSPSINRTQVLLTEQPVSACAIKPLQLQTEILKEAKTGYVGFFKELQTDKRLSSMSVEQEADLTYAIQLQNEEIEALYRGLKRS